jgi:hypothetical protein
LGVLYDLYLAEPQKALEQFEHYLTLAGDNKQVNGWVIELRKRVGAPAAPAPAPTANPAVGPTANPAAPPPAKKEPT